MIEVGQTYKDKNGNDVKIIFKKNNTEEKFPFVGVIGFDEDLGLFNSDGMSSWCGTREKDLIIPLKPKTVPYL